MTIRLSPATYHATLRDLGHAWANDMPSYNYRVKRTARLDWLFEMLEAHANAQAPHILTGAHTEARIFATHEGALSAARGLGITATPQRCLAREGWAVVIAWEGEPYYYRQATT